MAADAMTPKASEILTSLKFYGAEVGQFPGSTANTALSTLKFNELKFSGGEETADFKAGQNIMALERIVSQASSVSGQINLTSQSSFLAKYQDEGPLVELTVTIPDMVNEGDDVVLVVKGLMKLPDIDLLGNPGKIDFEIRPYGVAPLITFPT